MKTYAMLFNQLLAPRHLYSRANMPTEGYRLLACSTSISRSSIRIKLRRLSRNVHLPPARRFELYAGARKIPTGLHQARALRRLGVA